MVLVLRRLLLLQLLLSSLLVVYKFALFGQMTLVVHRLHGLVCIMLLGRQCGGGKSIARGRHLDLLERTGSVDGWDLVWWRV